MSFADSGNKINLKKLFWGEAEMWTKSRSSFLAQMVKINFWK